MRKLIIAVILLLATTYVFGADRYAVAGTPASPAAWASTTTWSANSGGSAGASIPTSADNVYIGELTNRSLTIKNATAKCNNVNVYAGSTLDRENGSGTLQIYGSVVNAGTITNTSNQPFDLTFSGSGTHTISGGGTYSGRTAYVVSTGNTIDLGTQVMGGTAASFTLESGATLITAHPNGINGNLTMTGTITLNTGANYVFNGSVAQVTGTLLPTTVNNLTINNTYSGTPDVSLSANVTVNGTLTMTDGTLNLNAHTLAYGASASLLYNGTAAQTIGPEWLAAGMTRPITISNTSTSGLTLDANKSTSSTVTVTSGATLNTGTSVISGTGSFTLNSGATLDIGSTGGISSSGATGNIQTTTRSFNNGANYVYNGTSGQITGNGLPSTVNNLTIANSSGVTMSGNVSVTTAATVTSGSSLIMGDTVISGGGSFTLNDSASISTANTAGLNGSITTTTSTFSSSANYTYNGTSAQVTGSYMPSTVNNLTIDNPNGVTWSGPVTVTGTLQVLQGNMELADQYFQVPNNAIPIAGFIVATSTPGGLYPSKIDRQWAISGTWTSGTVTCRYYWDAADDHDFDWSGMGVTPSVYKGATEYAATSSSLSTPKRWVEVSIPATDDLTKGTFNIGPAGDGTLPVELSSFTVTISALNLVTLQWVTQSETNVSGYRIYRNTEPSLETATMLNVFVPATNTSQMQVYVFTDEDVYSDGLYYYWLQNLDMDGANQFYGPITVNVALTGQGTPEIPILQGISSAYPNPFNPSVSLFCGMKRSGQAEVNVYNIRGQLVKTVFSGAKDEGNFTLQWDGSDNFGLKQPSGIYYIRMVVGGETSVKKVVLSK